MSCSILRESVGRPLVAGPKPIDHLGQVAQQARRVHLEVSENPGQVGVGQLDQLDEPVLDLDAGIGPRQAEPGGRLQGIQAGLVQGLDQGSGINAHRECSSSSRLESRT